MDFTVGTYQFLEDLWSRFPHYSKESLQELIDTQGMVGAYETLQKGATVRRFGQVQDNVQQDTEQCKSEEYEHESYDSYDDDDDDDDDNEDFILRNFSKSMKKIEKNGDDNNGIQQRTNSHSVNNYPGNNFCRQQKSNNQNICNGHNINNTFQNGDVNFQPSNNRFDEKQQNSEVLDNNLSDCWGSVDEQQEANRQVGNQGLEANGKSRSTFNSGRGKVWKDTVKSNIYSDLNFKNTSILEQDMWCNFENVQKQQQISNNDNSNQNIVDKFFQYSDEEDAVEKNSEVAYQNLSRQQLQLMNKKNSSNKQEQRQQQQFSNAQPFDELDSKVKVLRNLFPEKKIGDIEYVLTKFQNDMAMTMEYLNQGANQINNNCNNNRIQQEGGQNLDVQTLVQDLLQQKEEKETKYQQQQLQQQKQFNEQFQKQQQQQSIQSQQEIINLNSEEENDGDDDEEEQLSRGFGYVGVFKSHTQQSNQNYQSTSQQRQQQINQQQYVNGSSHNNNTQQYKANQLLYNNYNNNNYNNMQQAQYSSSNNNSSFVNGQQQIQQNNNLSQELQEIQMKKEQSQQYFWIDRIPYEQQLHDSSIYNKVMQILEAFEATDEKGNKLQGDVVHTVYIQQHKSVYKTKNCLVQAGFKLKPDIEIIEAKQDQLTQFCDRKVEDAYKTRDHSTEIYKQAKEMKRQADEAKSKGDHKTAGELYRKSQIHFYEARKFKKFAVDQIKWHHNQERVQKMLVDLHGLHLDEAIEWMEEIHDLAMQMISVFVTMPTVQVITGKGKHSADCQPKVKNAVVEWAQKKNLFVISHEGSLDILYKPRQV